MKIVILGDVHGRSLWSSIIEKEKDADKFIFMGDYFDSRESITAERQLWIFSEICSWRRKRIADGYEDINLIGNHDYHYMNICKDPPYSSYQVRHASDINKALESNMDLLQMAHSEGSFLFTHAGVSKQWGEDKGIDMTNAKTIANNVNHIFKDVPSAFGFTIGENYSMSGDDTCQTPIWIRPQSLSESLIHGINYIVGHTSVGYIKISPDNTDTSITLVDAQAQNEYLIIIDGIMSVGKIEY